MIVCVVYALIKQCKEQLMEAKRSSDFKVIFELNGKYNTKKINLNFVAKFETKYGDFIKEVYNAYDTFFGEPSILKLNRASSESIFNIRCMDVSNIIRSGDAEKKLISVEKALEKHYLPTQEQNKTLYNLFNSKHAKNEENEALSYSGINKMIKELHSKFNGENVVNNLSRGQITALHIKIHNIKAASFNTEKISVQVSCGAQTEEKENVNPLKTNFEIEIPFFGSESTNRYANIEIFDMRDPLSLKKKILFAKLDLHGFPLNTVTKLVLKLQEENPEIYNTNYKASEAEISVLLDTDEVVVADIKDQKPMQPLMIQDLEEVKGLHKFYLLFI